MKKKMILLAFLALLLLPLALKAQVLLNPDGTQVPQSPHTPETTRNQAPYAPTEKPQKTRPDRVETEAETEYVDIRPFYRIAGSDRYDTAARVANEVALLGQDIIMVKGDGLAEAVCAMPLAGKLQAAILLTDGLTLEEPTIREIRRLKPARVILFGTHDAFSPDLDGELEALGVQVLRITAPDPVALALKVNEDLAADHAIQKSTCALVSDQNPLDAIALMPVLARSGMAIYLLPNGQVTPEIEEAIATYDTLWIAGGEGSISSVVHDHLVQAGHRVERFAGPDRVQTALQIAHRFNRTTDCVVLARADHPDDALTAFRIALNRPTAILFIHESGPTPEVSAYLQANPLRKIYLLGGYTIFPPEVDDLLRAYLKL